MTITQLPPRQALLGYSAALGAAICYGTLAVLGRKIVSEFAPPLVATSFSMIFGTIVLFAIFHRDIFEDYAQKPSKRGWIFLILAGASATWGVTFWFLALSQAPAVLVAPVSGIHPLFSVLLAYLFLRNVEKITWRTVIGAVLAVVGVILITLGIE